MKDCFTQRHLGLLEERDIKKMLQVIGAESVESLIGEVVPSNIRLKQPLALPQEGMSEVEFKTHIEELASRNEVLRSFIGMGYYPTATPPSLLSLLSLHAFLCASVWDGWIVLPFLLHQGLFKGTPPPPDSTGRQQKPF